MKHPDGELELMTSGRSDFKNNLTMNRLTFGLSKKNFLEQTIHRPDNPEDWTSLELHTGMCKLGATEAEARAAASREGPRHEQGRWDVGTGVILDLREGYNSSDPDDRALARHRVASESPYLVLGSASAVEHLSAQNRQSSA